MPIRNYAIAFALLCTALTARSERTVISLDGKWNFRLDPQDLGQDQQWFTKSVAFTNTIIVPGAWQAQGYGKDGDKLHHNYEGKAWYKRDVRLPKSAPGQRLFLCFSGVHRSAEIWVNGVRLGRHIGYLSPFEFELTPAIAKNATITIAVCVDCKQYWDKDCLTGCVDLIDEMFTPWGGIWGHVWLEVRPAAWLEDVAVRTRIAPKPSCEITARVAGQGDGIQARLEVRSKPGREISRDADTVYLHDGVLLARVDMHAANLWSPETPNLYVARLELLQDGAVVDRRDVPFGLRDIKIEGHNFYLNGKKLFLRGYGDDCIYPETMAPPTDKEVYRRKLQVARDNGFNFVRHHSHFVPPEYYEAADEVGMLISPELPIAYQEYYNKAKGAALELYKTEWAAAITRLRNHPSIFDWCVGNELYDSVPIARELYRSAKQLDPTRPVIDSDGLSGGLATQGPDRSTLDFYSVQFDENALPLDNPAKHHLNSAPKKPVISHETGNYVTVPRPDLIEQFKDNFKPFWLATFRAKLDKLGLQSEARQWSINSEKLYYLSHKLNLEDLRKNSWLSGYEWWLLQDYWTGANGLYDTYFRPKSIRPEAVRQFNAPAVLLLDGLPLTIPSSQSLKLKLLVSNYAPEPIRNGSIRWTVKLGNRLLARHKQSSIAAGQGELIEALKIPVDLAPVFRPEQMIVLAELQAGHVSTHNDWSCWVYPDPERLTLDARSKAPLFATPELCPTLKPLGAEPILARGPLSARAVYVVTQPTLRTVSAVEAGASMLCLSPTGIFPSAPNRFKPAWWLGNPNDCNAGTVVYPHPVTRDMASESWCDAGWYRLLEGAQAFVLDEVPFVVPGSQPGKPKPQPVLVRALDVHTVCRNKALLFEARLGRGCLVVSGLHLEPQPDAPERRWLLKQLIDYAATFPQPKAELPLSFIRDKVKSLALPEGPFISGYVRLLAQGGEQADYPSYREAQAPLHVCRQWEAGRSLEWETAPVPPDWTGSEVTFVFAGGLGWVSQPKSEGFALLLNDQPLLRFDVAREGQTWFGDNGKVKLQFVPRKTLPEDALGVFYLTVPADQIKPGHPCRLTVRSNAKSSRRWFGLNAYPFG
jgi:beta-galactosidase